MTTSTLLGLEYMSPNFLFYDDRLKTFDLWSSQIQPDKFQLSSAGFYYTGRNDAVECFSCGIRLHQWKIGDDPLTEHRIHSTNCLFLLIIGQLKCSNSSIDIGPSSSIDIGPSWSLWK